MHPDPKSNPLQKLHSYIQWYDSKTSLTRNPKSVRIDITAFCSPKATSREQSLHPETLYRFQFFACLPRVPKIG